jgi:hypothetical protein
MRWASLMSFVLYAVATGSAPAAGVEWRRFVIPQAVGQCSHSNKSNAFGNRAAANGRLQCGSMSDSPI